MNDEYIKRSDVDRIISERIRIIERNIDSGKGLINSVVNLKAVQDEIDMLYGVKMTFEDEPIWRKPQ